MNLKRRLELLESKLKSDPVVLHMRGGQTIQLPGGHKTVLELFRAEMSGNATPEQRRQLELISKCQEADEPGGAHMVELLRAMLHGPIESAD